MDNTNCNTVLKIKQEQIILQIKLRFEKLIVK